MSSAYLYNKWRLDLGSSSAKVAVRGELSPPGYGAIRGELSPPGYGGNLGSTAHSESSSNRNEQREQQQHLLSKRAWELALGPIKGLPMNVFMMYMAGSTISIFPIMMVAMMAWRPIKAFMTLQATFKPLQADWTGSLILHKLVYALGNLAGIALAVYKCHSMGLLPTHASDWLDFVEPARYMHSSFVSVVYS